MVPDKVDLQYDFVRDDTIETFAEQFGDFVEVGQADGGVMHAAWPSDWMTLEDNRVLESAEEIGGVEVPAGAWVQDWGFNHDPLWQLVDDGILEGYSIGAIDAEWAGPYEQDAEDLEGVTVPDTISDEEFVWELVSAIIREVSAVDIPAVPDAMILETKDAYEKRLADHLGNRDGFVEEALERGHSEDEAERLWTVLSDAVDVDGAGEPGKQADSVLTRAGKAALGVLTGKEDGSADKAGDFEASIFRVVAPDDEADRYEDAVLGIGVDFPNSDVHVDWRNEVFPDELDNPHVSIYGSVSDLEQATGNNVEQMDTLNAKAAKSLFDSRLQGSLSAKEGRTLSNRNRDNLFATIDASLDVLEDAGVDHQMTRFTDRDDVGFTLDDHTASEWANDEDEEDDKPYEVNSDAETSDQKTDNMSDSDDPFDDAPEWAKALRDEQQENSKQIEELKEGDGDGGSADDPDKAWDDAPEWAKELRSEQQQNKELIEQISKQSDGSFQLEDVDPDEKDTETGAPGLDSNDMKSKLFGVPLAEEAE